MDAKPKSSKHMECERTNFSGEVGTVQLRWKLECGNVTSPFVILGEMGFGDSWGEGQGTIAVGRKVPVLRRGGACLYQGIPGTCWKFTMAWLESEET